MSVVYLGPMMNDFVGSGLSPTFTFVWNIRIEHSPIFSEHLQYAEMPHWYWQRCSLSFCPSTCDTTSECCRFSFPRFWKQNQTDHNFSKKISHSLNWNRRFSRRWRSHVLVVMQQRSIVLEFGNWLGFDVQVGTVVVRSHRSHPSVHRRSIVGWWRWTGLEEQKSSWLSIENLHIRVSTVVHCCWCDTRESASRTDTQTGISLSTPPRFHFESSPSQSCKPFPQCPLNVSVASGRLASSDHLPPETGTILGW